MTSKCVWITIIAAVAGFVGGFLFANALNRSELDAVKAGNNSQPQQSQNSAAQNPSDLTLTNEEIGQKIAEADANPDNFAFQRNLGIALYRYAAMKQDTELLSESARILRRALSLNPEDSDLQVALGNAHFDIGYFKKDNSSFARAREYYQKVLTKKPADVDLRTDLGLTYFLQEPPELDLAAAEFEKALETNPKHEKTLQFLVQSLIKKNDNEKAAKYLEQLKQANPSSPSIAELSTLLSAATSQK